MKTITVKALMIPLEEYATVRQDTNLFEAVLALENAQQAFDPAKHKHRAILVLDENNQVVGKLAMLDILKALEPKYAELDAGGILSREGYSPEYVKSMLQDHFLWSGTLEFICSRGAGVKVQDIMQRPDECTYIEDSATLDEAIHQLVVCRYQSLLVVQKGKVVGILRLSDVFSQVCEKIKTCGT
jgi:CBS domain-containing protein